MILFGFLYINSIPLVNLLEQTELFGVSQEIQEQLCQGLSDLVTLVASVAMHFHAAIHDASTQSVSINIYSTFSSQIKTFHDRCAAIAQSMWHHQVLAGDMDPDAGTNHGLTLLSNISTLPLTCPSRLTRVLF